MFANLWLLNIFLVANAIGFLAFATFGWLYLDTYRKDKTYRHNLIRAIGGFLIGGGFLATLLQNIDGDAQVTITVLQMLLFNVGITLTVIASFLEPVPLLPVLKADKGKAIENKPLEKIFFTTSNSSLRVMTALASLLLPFIGTFTIAMQTHYKVKFGLSKGFKSLIYVWWLLTIYMLMHFMNLAWSKNVVWIDELTREFSTGWIVNQLIAVAIAILLFVWSECTVKVWLQ